MLNDHDIRNLPDESLVDKIAEYIAIQTVMELREIMGLGYHDEDPLIEATVNDQLNALLDEGDRRHLWETKPITREGIC